MGWVFAEAGEDLFEEGEHVAGTFEADDPVPEWLEFFPATGIGGVAETAVPGWFVHRSAKDRTPAIEVPVCLPVAGFEGFGRHVGRPVDDVAGVV